MVSYRLPDGKLIRVLTDRQISAWKQQLQSQAAAVFESIERREVQTRPDVVTMQAKIGVTLENDFLELALNKAGLLSAKR